MNVLVTGSAGLIGREVEQLLRSEGHKVVGFDAVNGDDVRDAPKLFAAMRGCDAVVHGAAVLDEDSPDLMAVNLAGTWNVLAAAEAAQVQRVVFWSSAAALGVFKGERAPDYLPIDDAHPCYPISPYAISKYLGEEMCRLWTQRTGISTICLRPPGVFAASTYEFIIENRRADANFEWTPYWEYGAFLDVRDAARAALCALTCPGAGHIRLLLCADDISSATQSSRALAAFVHPDIEWRGGAEYETQPFKALTDTRRAKAVLGWAPLYKWRAIT